MAIGKFEGLYTFQDVAKIYNMDNSTLRKQVANKKLIVNKDVKKFGKVWLITEQAMLQHFGSGMFQLYKNELNLQKIQEEKIEKIRKENEKSKRKGKGTYSMSGEYKEPKGSSNNYNDHGQGLDTVMSFSFGADK